MRRSSAWELRAAGQGLVSLGLALSCLTAGCTEAHGGGEAGAGGDAPLDPHTIPKFVDPLVVPPAMPPEGIADGAVQYEIAARQLRQQMLPRGMPETTVWGYGRASDPETLQTPSFTIEARSHEPVR